MTATLHTQEGLALEAPPRSAAITPAPRPHTPPLPDSPALARGEVMLAAGGLLALGAGVGLKAGVATTGVMALLLPASALAVGAATLPGLYIASALLGVAPPLDRLLREVVRAVADQSAAALGLTPALVCLVVASDSADEALVLATLAVILCALLGLRALYRRVIAPAEDLRALLLFGLWAALCVAFGWQVYLKALSLSGGLL